MQPEHHEHRAQSHPEISDECLASLLVDLAETLRQLHGALAQLEQHVCRTPHAGLGRGGLAPREYYAYRHGGVYE